MTQYFIGIDTSSYTTSLAVIDGEDNIILDLRKVLEVEKGKKGLRQQEAVFQHIQNLPLLIDYMAQHIDIRKIEKIACSNKPRNLKESYMPVFVVGKGQAFVLSKVLNIPYKEFSHQEGHLGAGMINSGFNDIDKFIGIHISGGTTEMLLIENIEKGFQIDIVGGTLDISAGQLIDRIGVEIGLDFPSGKKMDQISQWGTKLDLNIPINIKNDIWFNLSGMENYFKNIIKNSEYQPEDILMTLFYTLSQFLEKIILKGCNIYDIENVLVTGGVAANSIIRRELSKQLYKKGINLYFPKASLCTDNSVGIAYLGKIKK